MKITNFGRNEITVKLEEFARKLNQTAQQMGMQDPQAFAEQIRKKAAELLATLKNTLLLGRPRMTRPEFFRTRIKKRVVENLEEDFQDPHLINQITDSLLQAAKEDPYYRRLFDLEEKSCN